METLDFARMNEILDRVEPLLTKLEERDEQCRKHLEDGRMLMEQNKTTLTTLKWLAGLILIPMMSVFIKNQVDISKSVTHDEVDESYAKKEQVCNAFSYAAGDLSYTIKELNDSVGVKSVRPFIWNMETIKAIIKQ